MKPIQSRAVLVRIKFGLPQRQAKDNQAGRQFAADHGAEEGAIDMLQKFYPKSKDADKDAWGMFEDVVATRGAVGSYYKSKTAPWDRGVRLLPTALFMDFTAELRRGKEAHRKAADELAKKFDLLIKKAEAARNGMFDRSDYPADAESFRSQLSIEESWMPLPDENNIVLDLADDAIREIALSARQQAEESMRKLQSSNWERLGKVIRKVAEKLAVPDGIFRDTLIGNVRELLEVLPALNLAGDAELAKFSAEIQEKISGFDPDNLRKMPAMRQEVAKAANDILARMKDFLPTPT